MIFSLTLRIGDVTRLASPRPALHSKDSPMRVFTVARTDSDFKFDFDGQSVTVPFQEIPKLLVRIDDGTLIDWQNSRDPEIQTIFRPFNRVLQRLDSTPAYQLFLAGFHICESIGLFDFSYIPEAAIEDSFRYLVGYLTWPNGRNGKLFFLPDDIVDQSIENELIANSKIGSVELIGILGDAHSILGRKLYVPYANPIGFNTKVDRETEVKWQRINELMHRQSGGLS